MEEDLRKLTKSNNRKKAAIIILLFAFAMASHIFLNIIYELCTRSITRILTSSLPINVFALIKTFPFPSTTSSAKKRPLIISDSFVITLPS